MCFEKGAKEIFPNLIEERRRIIAVGIGTWKLDYISRKGGRSWRIKG